MFLFISAFQYKIWRTDFIMSHLKKKKNWRRDLLQQLEFCTCILLLLVMKPHNMELEEIGISVKVILSAKNVLGLACTYLYSFLKIPSWNIVTASAFCLPRFVQMLFEVMQLK